MEELRQTLKEKLDKIVWIYIAVNDMYHYAECFNNLDTDGKCDVVISSYFSGLCLIPVMLNRVLLIEAAKLCGESKYDEFSIEKFVDSLSEEGDFKEIGIPKEKIDNWKLKIEENKRAIGKVRTLRDKVLAHTDDPYKNYDICNVFEKGLKDDDKVKEARQRYYEGELTNGITYKEVKGLIVAICVVLREINFEVFSVDLDIESTRRFDRERCSVLPKLLAKASKRVSG